MIINLDPIQSECWKETKTDAADRSFSRICQALVCGCEATCERAAVETSVRVWMSTLQDETVRHRRIMMNIFFQSCTTHLFATLWTLSFNRILIQLNNLSMPDCAVILTFHSQLSQNLINYQLTRNYASMRSRIRIAIVTISVYWLFRIQSLRFRFVASVLLYSVLRSDWIRTR